MILQQSLSFQVFVELVILNLDVDLHGQGIREPTTQNHNLETAEDLHRCSWVAHALTKWMEDKAQALK